MPLSVHRTRACGRGRARRGGPKGARLIQDRLKIASGRAAFAADLDPAEILHAVAVGAPQAGVRLVSANGAAARSLPGVAAVITALDEPGLLGPVARYTGAPLAGVAALDREAAERGALALEIGLEAEGANLDVQTSPAVAWAEVHEGDPDSAFSTCEQVVEGTWRWPFASPSMLEPSATRAWLDEDGRLVLRASTAAPFALRARVARDLGLPAASVRVVRPQVGAPFGALREPRAASLCAALALQAGRAVSLVEEWGRGEVAPPEAAHLVRMRAGFRAGRLAAVDALLVVNLGAQTDEPGASFAPASFFLRSTGVPFRLDARAVLTGLPPASDARLQATRALRFALEGARNEGARAAGPEAMAVRAAAENTALREAITWAAGEGEPWREAPPEPWSRRGRGLAVAGPWSQAGATATAALTSNPDGSLVLRLGAGGVPPGAAEALVDAAARGMGVAPAAVSVVGTDTDTAPAQEAGAVEPWLLARAVSEAAARLRAAAAPAGRRKARATAEATVALGAEELPAALAVVRADVEVDTDTGLGRVARLLVAPLPPSGGALVAWEEGQLLAALPLVFGTATLPNAIDAPEMVRRAGEGRASAASRNAGIAADRPAAAPAGVPADPAVAGPRLEPAPLGPPFDLSATGPLPDLLPAAVAAIVHAFRDATAVVVREVPLRPERFLKDADIR